MKVSELLLEANSHMGYRVVGYDGDQYFSLATQEPIELNIGEQNQDPKGFFLGTSAEFATDYYTGLSDYDDVLLQYEYNSEDVLRGNPVEKHSEIVVRKAILLKIIEI